MCVLLSEHCFHSAVTSALKSQDTLLRMHTHTHTDTLLHTHARSRNNKHGAAAALWCLDSLLLQVSASQFDFLSVQLADLKNDLSQNVPVK